jgi:metal-dependent hydrolase (beta-lactamase superfamily II)
MVENMRRLGLSLQDVEVIVLSHGHWDHVTGMEGVARTLGRPALPVLIHPEFWKRRRIRFPGLDPAELPSTSRSALEGAGFQVVEERRPSFLLDGSVLITGEVDRTTEFETGFRGREALADGGWQPDPLILDDQALVLRLSDRGLVVLSGCGHAGIVNAVHYAQKLTGTREIAAIIGGFRLSGPMFETIIAPTCPRLRRALGRPPRPCALHRLEGRPPARRPLPRRISCRARSGRRSSSDSSWRRHDDVGLQAGIVSPVQGSGSEDERGEAQQERAGDRLELLAVTSDFLVDDERGERGHPPQDRDADGEHHEHQRPAAAQTEEAVPETEVERTGRSTAIVRDQVGARVAALREAGVLQLRELERPGDGENAADDEPPALVQPRQSFDRTVDADVSEEGERAEGRPDERVPA